LSTSETAVAEAGAGLVPPSEPPPVTAAAGAEPPEPPIYTVQRIGNAVVIDGPPHAEITPQSARMLADALLEAAGDAFLRPGVTKDEKGFVGTAFERRWPQRSGE
jgi:hypothetical protein